MLKKTMALLLSAMLLAGVMAGCGSTNSGTTSSNPTSSNPTTDTTTTTPTTSSNTASESVDDTTPTTPEQLTVSTAYGDVKIPYAPERICVLDMNTLDMVHTLGLGDKIASLAYNKKHTMYLADYYTSETIVSLTVSSRNTEEGADPYEAYYSIDADLIIGDVDAVTDDAYAVLSQIAPTVVLPNADENENGMYAGVMENAAVVASIWGLDEEMASISETYDAKYKALVEECDGKTYLLGGGDVSVNSFRLATSEDGGRAKTSESSEKSGSSEKSEKTSSSGGSNKAANTTSIIAFLTELGTVNITDEAPEEVRATALAELDNDSAAKKMTEWIESVAPAGLFVTQRDYETYEDVLNAGYEYLYLDTLTVYQNGGFAVLGTEWTQLSGGLTAMMTMVDQLADAFLN